MAIVDQKPGPGRRFYLLALVPLMLGFGAMGVILATNLPRMNDGLEQIVAPGERTLTLEPGTQTVFLEARSVVDGVVYAVDEVSGLSVQVVGPDGAPVAVKPPVGSMTYTLGGRSGYAINTFEAVAGGDYTVSANYGDGTGPETVIAVGQGFVGKLLVIVFSSLGAVFGSGLVALLVVVWVALRRKKAGLSF